MIYFGEIRFFQIIEVFGFIYKNENEINGIFIFSDLEIMINLERLKYHV